MIKKILKITAVIFFVLFIGILITPFIFKGKLLELTKQEINNNLNATVTFEKFSVQILRSFPNLTVSISNLDIVGDGQFAQDTLLSFKKLSATVDIMTVIKGEDIGVIDILIDAPRIRALIAADGSANYDIFIYEDEEEEELAVDTVSSPFAIQLQNIAIRNGYIEYHDIPANMHAIIDEMNVRVSGDFTDVATHIKTSVEIANLNYVMDGIPYLSQAEFELIAEIEADFVAEKYTLRDNIMRINALELAYTGWLQFIEDETHMDISFASSQNDFKQILSLVPGVYMEGFEDISTDGVLSLSGNVMGVYKENPEYYPAFDLALTVKNGKLQYPDVPKPIDNIQAELFIMNRTYDLDDMIIHLNKLQVSFADNPFNMSFYMSHPLSNPLMKAEMKGTIDLNSMKDFIPLENTTLRGILTSDLEFAARMSDIEQENYDNIIAVGQLGLTDFTYIDVDYPDGIFISDLAMTFSPQFVYLEKCSLKIGKSDMVLSGRLENFIPYALADETIKGTLDFYSHFLDANEFLDEAETETIQTDTTAVSYEIIPVPSNIDFVLRTKIDRLLYDIYDVENIEGTVVIRDSRVSMEGLRMNMLQGTMRMSGYYATPEYSKPEARFDLDISGFDMAESFKTFNTIQRLAPIAEYLSGAFSTKLSFHSNLEQDFTPLLSSLNGSGMFQTSAMSMQNSGMQTFLSDRLKQEQFRTVTAQNILMLFEIVNGNIEIKPFETNFNGNNALVEGRSALDGGLDYKIAFQIPTKNLGAVTNEALQSLQNLAGKRGIDADMGEFIDVSLLVGGTLANTTYNAVLGNATSGVFSSVRSQAEQRLREEQARLQREAQARIDETRRKAEAEAQRARQEAETRARQEVQQQTQRVQEQAQEVKDEVKDRARSQVRDAIRR